MRTDGTAAGKTAVAAGMVALWLCWGSSFPAIRVMVTTLPPLLASGTVFLVAGVVLLASRPSALRGMSRRQLTTACGVGVCLLGAQGMVAVAEQYVYASVAALLVAAVPLWVVLLRLVVGDRPSRAGVVRLLVGFAGVAIVLAASGGGVGWTGWSLLVVVAAVAWATGTLWASRATGAAEPRAATVVQLLAGGVVLLLTGLGTGELSDVDLATVSGSSAAAFCYLVVVDSLAGFALYNWLLRSAPVSLVSTYAYAVPVVAYLVGVLVLGEPFHALVLLGAAAILAAVAAELRATSG